MKKVDVGSLSAKNKTVERKDGWQVQSSFLVQDVKQLGKPRRNFRAYLPLNERRFSQAGGRSSQCLAAEHRLL